MRRGLLTFKVCFYRWQLQNILTLVFWPFPLTQFFSSSLRTLFYPFFSPPAPFQCLWLFFPGLQTARPEVVGAGSRAGTQLGVVGVCVCLCTRLWVRKSVRMCAVILCVCVIERWRDGRWGEEGRRDGGEEQTDAAQTPEGLRSCLFLATSPGDTDVWVRSLSFARSHKHIYPFSFTHINYDTHFTPSQTLSPQNTPWSKTRTHMWLCQWKCPSTESRNSLKADTNWISLTLRPCFLF